MKLSLNSKANSKTVLYSEFYENDIRSKTIEETSSKKINKSARYEFNTLDNNTYGSLSEYFNYNGTKICDYINNLKKSVNKLGKFILDLDFSMIKEEESLKLTMLAYDIDSLVEETILAKINNSKHLHDYYDSNQILINKDLNRSKQRETIYIENIELCKKSLVEILTLVQAKYDSELFNLKNEDIKTKDLLSSQILVNNKDNSRNKNKSQFNIIEQQLKTNVNLPKYRSMKKSSTLKLASKNIIFPTINEQNKNNIIFFDNTDENVSINENIKIKLPYSVIRSAGRPIVSEDLTTSFSTLETSMTPESILIDKKQISNSSKIYKRCYTQKVLPMIDNNLK